jgi:hypothetical protein
VQLTGALGSCGSGNVQQKCCSLASILAARRCHCRLGVSRQSMSQLEHMQHHCIRAHRAIVEQQIFNRTAAEAADTPGSFPAAATAISREIAPGSWADLARASAGGEASMYGETATVDEESSASSVGRLEAGTEKDEGLQGEVTYSVFGSSGAGSAPASAAAVKLFVGVLTAGKNADRRAAIRESWGSDRRLHRCALHALPDSPTLSLLLICGASESLSSLLISINLHWSCFSHLGELHTHLPDVQSTPLQCAFNLAAAVHPAHLYIDTLA